MSLTLASSSLLKDHPWFKLSDYVKLQLENVKMYSNDDIDFDIDALFFNAKNKRMIIQQEPQLLSSSSSVLIPTYISPIKSHNDNEKNNLSSSSSSTLIPTYISPIKAHENYNDNNNNEIHSNYNNDYNIPDILSSSSLSLLQTTSNTQSKGNYHHQHQHYYYYHYYYQL